MTAEQLRQWLERHRLTAAQAGEQLWLDRATVFRCLRKEGELPRCLVMACAAIDLGVQL